jgi:hypothetical protein
MVSESPKALWIPVLFLPFRPAPLSVCITHAKQEKAEILILHRKIDAAKQKLPSLWSRRGENS